MHTLENIFIDLNIIVDVVLERVGYKSSLAVIELSDSSDVQLFVSAHTVTTFAYLLEQAKIKRSEIHKYIEWMLMTFIVIPTDQIVLNEALKSRILDYEDAVIDKSARSCGALFIVTRNMKDFKWSSVRAITPEDYLLLSKV
ncbi:MAG TPA: PIN domain-containing protein [Candidatus Saccharimonadales bacterium]